MNRPRPEPEVDTSDCEHLRFSISEFGFSKGAIVIAALVVAILFAAEHLPTYNWNFLQALMGVGVARIVLLLPYFMTKNLVVSAGAHILNDWMFFGVSILSATLAASQ